VDEIEQFSSEKGNIRKIFHECEHLFRNRGNLKPGEMHHCLRGMDAPDAKLPMLLSFILSSLNITFMSIDNVMK